MGSQAGRRLMTDTVERTRTKPCDQVDAWVRDDELDDAAHFHDQEMARFGASGFPMQFDSPSVREAHAALSDAYYDLIEARKTYRAAMRYRIVRLMQPIKRKFGYDEKSRCYVEIG